MKARLRYSRTINSSHVLVWELRQLYCTIVVFSSHMLMPIVLIFSYVNIIKGQSVKDLLWVFRWFKFTLKPPNSVMHGNLLSAIWDTSHWNFFVKFGLKTAWHIFYDILWSLLTYVNFWQLQGRLSTFAKIRGPQKIKVFSMKERSVVDEARRF